MSQPVEIRLARRLASVEVVGVPSRGGPGAASGSAPQELQAELAALRQARQAVETAAAECQDLSRRLRAEAEAQLMELSVEIARKVLMQEIRAQRYEIEPIVQEALRRLPACQQVTVHLNAQDLARCPAASEGKAGGNVRFLADPAVQPGECLVETPDGSVESSLEGHLQEIGRALGGPE